MPFFVGVDAVLRGGQGSSGQQLVGDVSGPNSGSALQRRWKSSHNAVIALKFGLGCPFPIRVITGSSSTSANEQLRCSFVRAVIPTPSLHLLTALLVTRRWKQPTLSRATNCLATPRGPPLFPSPRIVSYFYCGCSNADSSLPLPQPRDEHTQATHRGANAG